MPNICSFCFEFLAPTKKAAQTLVDWAQSDYSYTRWHFDESAKEWYAHVRSEDGTYELIKAQTKQKDACNYCGVFSKGKLVKNTSNHLGYRTFEFFVESFEKVYAGYLVKGYGSCAWSLFSCWFDLGVGCYMSDSPKSFADKAISITEACEKLGIEFQVISEEPGMGFSEKYHVYADGSYNEDCRDLTVLYGMEDSDSYEDWLNTVKEGYNENVYADVLKNVTEEMWKTGNEIYILDGRATENLYEFDTFFVEA